MAGCDKRNLLCEANLEKEFEFIDVDKDNYIGPSDVENFMVQNVDPGTVEADEDSQDYQAMCISLKKANITYKMDHELKLDDDVIIKNFRWSGLKKHAMSEDFEESEMFVSQVICKSFLSLIFSKSIRMRIKRWFTG